VKCQVLYYYSRWYIYLPLCSKILFRFILTSMAKVKQVTAVTHGVTLFVTTPERKKNVPLIAFDVPLATSDGRK